MSKAAAANAVRIVIVLLCAYAVYQAYSYTGIYKWLAEWQLAQFGSYNMRLTLVGAILLPALPLCLAAEMFGIPYRTRRQPGDAAAGRPANHGRWMVILGMVAIAVAAGAFLLGYQKSQEPVVTETVDLALAKAPQSDHVRMTAIARTDMIMRFEERGRLRFYVPLTAPNWKRSDPLVYFLQTNITAYVGPDGQTQSLDARTPPFRMTQTGVLVRNDLPGPVAKAFRRHNLTIAAPHQVLELSPGADLAPYWVAAGVGGLVGFILVLVGGLASLQRRRAAVPSGSDAGGSR